jgi:redox-sensitive bicupin YhaK (pirin superfamily)
MKTMPTRDIKHIAQARPTIEGAGVRLRRAFGFGDPADYDPFLLLDDFRNDSPPDYAAGFPWHPHRGMETITYVLAGSVEHQDSLGNKGVLGAGDVQWMTAGSGILHQEMPKGDEHGRMYGFQLWANLPAALKMTRPRYQDIKGRDVPEVADDDGTRARIICGKFWGKTGPVEGVAAEPRYLDIFVPAGKTKRLPVETTKHAFSYVFEGSGTFRDSSPQIANRSLVLFDRGDEVVVHAGAEGIRFLLVSGKPIEEPVAWGGPIVMNTQQELQQAFEELERGTFIK